jgi:hypothetical protein
MKKLRFLAFLTAISAVLVFQSCDEGEDTKPAPTVVLDTETGQNIPGGSVTITATVSSPNGGKALTVYVGGVEIDDFEIDGAQEFEQEFTHQIPASAVIGSTIVISFQATDNKDFSSSIANFILTVGDPVIVLTGNLATQTLNAGVPYLIKSQAIVPTGVTVTVQPGAIIKGDKATKGLLIIQPGGKLIANGTSSQPIVFTSNQGVGERDRGDWGGIVWLGNAYVNQSARPAIEGVTPAQNYGTTGTDFTAGATEDNGSMKFVRIEYAGIELTPNNETNSLTMGALGGATVLENVQVSYGGDDGFEWFGGKVNGKRLISLSTWDDDFDTDFGWSGNVQWGIIVRNPFFADQSGSNAFESDNQNNGNSITGICDGTVNTGCTSGVFSNITVLGPRDIQTRSISANYQNALHIRRRSNISIFNSFFSGFRIGLRIDDQGTLDNLTSGTAVHQYNVLSVPGTAGTGTSATATDGLFVTGLSGGDASAIATYWSSNNNTSFNNITAATPITDIGIAADLFWSTKTSSTFPTNPSFVLGAGVAGANNLNNSANFTNAKMGSFFDKTITYRGAFGATDWTDGWSEFQPLSKVY